jgi:AcrR family transcriptional regulator
MNIHLYLQQMRARDENKIAAIRQHALEMIVNEGFDGFSMQKLAKAAGVSPATIYIYFQDKEDLILQLYKEESNNFFSAIIEDFDPDVDFATGLKIQWLNRAKYAIANPKTAHFMEHIGYTPLHVKAIAIRHEAFGIAMQKFVSKAIRNKELVEMPFEVYWSVAFAPLYNLVRMHQHGSNIKGDPFELTDKILNKTLKLVLKALKP